MEETLYSHKVVAKDQKSARNLLSALKKREACFVHTHCGTVNQIDMFSGDRFIFVTHKEGDEPLRGGFLIGRTRHEILALHDKGIRPPAVEGDYPSPVCYRGSVILENLNKPLIGLDINHCYWRTARLLGYISKELYDKGCSKPDYKQARLAAIGTLAKKVMVDEWAFGKRLSHHLQNEEQYKITVAFHLHIVHHVRELMLDAAQEFPGLGMWLTDCAYVAPQHEDDMAAFLKSRGYVTKRKAIMPLSFEKGIFSYLDGDQDKKIHVGQNQIII